MRKTTHTTHLLAAILLLLGAARATAQELEYKMELGGMAGGSFYMGDANYSLPFADMGAAAGAVARYNLNPRMALKGNIAVGNISGNTAAGDNRLPGGKEVNFSRTLYDLGVQFEYNFFAYGNRSGFNDTRRLAPYIMGGAGLTFAPEPADNILAPNLSLGAGVKYKFAPRWNVGIEWSMRFALTDELDVTEKGETTLSDPYQIKGSGLKNKDSYSFTMVYLTYDLFAKLRKCNN